MKKILLFTVLLSLGILSSKELTKFTNSKIEWEGSKPTGTHSGDISLETVKVEIDKKGNILKGEFVINMGTINCTDLEGGGKTKLENHLKGEDFFDVKKFSKSKFVITNVTNIKGGDYNKVIMGDLTIKGITNKVSFKAKEIYKLDHILLTSEEIEIDRTKWDIKYKSKSIFSNLKDKFIDDIMKIKFSMEVK